MHKVLLVLVVISFVACRTIKDYREPNSFKTAIILLDKAEIRGINTEYAYLQAHYPGYRLYSQALVKNGKRAYDVFTFYPRGQRDYKKVYFDITSFYGK